MKFQEAIQTCHHQQRQQWTASAKEFQQLGFQVLAQHSGYHGHSVHQRDE